MPKCIDQDFPCQSPDYIEFDATAEAELRDPPTVSQIVNSSEFCTFVPLEEAIQLVDLTHKDYIKRLQGKIGLYHLWIDYDYCDEHDNYTMLCVYVGKGLADVRINSHIKHKWPHRESLYVSFYECNNRIAKYLEQLFLDTYEFFLNSRENCGNKHLFAVWDSERYVLGTELHSISDLSNITSTDDL